MSLLLFSVPEQWNLETHIWGTGLFSCRVSLVPDPVSSQSLELDGPRGCGPIFCIQIQVQILAQLWCGLLDEEPRVSSEKFNLSGHFHFLEVKSYSPEKAYK